MIDNHDIEARDVIADAIHEAFDSGCVHDPGMSAWTGQPEAVPCVYAAQVALEKLAEAGIQVARP